MKKIIDEYENEKRSLSGDLEEELDWSLKDCGRESESVVHEVLQEIINVHSNGKVGVVNGLEGGLTVDYIHKETKEEWRFIMGFTELGYWTYCNAPKRELKKKGEE